VALNKICDQRNIERLLGNTILKIDVDNREAIFKNNANGNLLKVHYDFLHIVPPQSPPQVIKESPLAD